MIKNQKQKRKTKQNKNNNKKQTNKTNCCLKNTTLKRFNHNNPLWYGNFYEVVFEEYRDIFSIKFPGFFFLFFSAILAMVYRQVGIGLGFPLRLQVSMATIWMKKAKIVVFCCLVGFYILRLVNLFKTDISR